MGVKRNGTNMRRTYDSIERMTRPCNDLSTEFLSDFAINHESFYLKYISLDNI